MDKRESSPAVMVSYVFIMALVIFGVGVFFLGKWLLQPDDFERVCGDLGNTHVAVLDNDHRVCIRGDKVVYRG